MRVDAPLGQVGADRLGGLREDGLVQDRHLVPTLEDAGQVAEQTGTDDHRVRRVGADVHRHRFRHGLSFREQEEEPRPFLAATAAGLGGASVDGAAVSDHGARRHAGRLRRRSGRDAEFSRRFKM